MNRKDIILVAVLINMGLLVILFTSALKSNAHLDSDAGILASGSKVATESVQIAKSEDSLDQVDKILTQYVQKEQVLVTKPVEMVEKNAAQKQVSEEVSLIPSLQGEEFKEVIVMQGDFLEKIAKRYQTNVEEIMKINQMKNTNLRIGQILYVPNIPAVADSTVSFAKNTSIEMPKSEYYIMKKGDNPWSISIKNHMKLEDLLKLNNLDENKAKKLKPGDKLRIR